MSLLDRAVLHFRRAAKPHVRQWRFVLSYVGLMALLWLVLAAMRMWLAGPEATLGQLAVSQLDNVSAGVIAAIVAALLLPLLFPRPSLEEELVVLDSWNIRPVLEAPLEDTRYYYFRGRSGRWIRSTALPALHAAAKQESATRSVHLILPDPGNAALLKEYADYRNSLPRSASDPWTVERIRNEIVATILEAGRLAAGSAFFEARVTLQADFSLLRADLSERHLVLTREDDRWPGWMSPARSKFYESWLQDLSMVEARGRQIVWPLPLLPDRFTAADVGPALQAMNLGFQVTLAESRQILRAMKDRSSPYG